jgi:serine phosphatase RsbU (regulator of sigma subunit)
MSLPIFFKSAQPISQLDVESDLQRKANFLKPLLIGLIILLFLALLAMLTKNSNPFDYFIVSIALIFNLVIFYLYRRRHIQLAAHLFCYGFNTLIFLYIPLNLFTLDGNQTTAISLTYLLAVSILLAGLLISPQATFGFATLNSGLIFTPYLIFFAGAIGESLALTLPPIGFLYLLAIVSWLYQRTLNQAYARLNETQQQLLHTQLVQRDLEIARDLQQRLYPPPPDAGPYFAIACRSQPARETSGDFYDFIQLGPNEWGIVVADVTGKSLAAALVMAMTRSTLRSESHRFVSPAMLLRRANQVLFQDESVDQMITVLYGVLNTEAFTFHFANAGHVYPLIKQDQGVRYLELNGMPLKAAAHTQYHEKAVPLYPGAQLILLSDGIIEAMNANREMFGFERLIETINGDDCATPAQTLQHIWHTVEMFRGSVEQQDDTTLVVIGIDSAAPPASAEQTEEEAPAELEPEPA